MKTKKASFFLFVFLSYIPVLAQVDTAWVRRYNGPGNQEDIPVALALDIKGNVYVTGRSRGDGTKKNFDYATIKYAPNGDTLWVRRYNGPDDGTDEPTDLAVDDSGNVYVTGRSVALFNGFDYATIKYAPNGDTLWVRRYNGPVNDWDTPRCLEIDKNGNVVVTGQSPGEGTFKDFTTIKYAPHGDTVWVRRFNYAGSSWDGPANLTIDDSGNIYLCGVTGLSGSDSGNFTTLKYSAKGDLLWSNSYNRGGKGQDMATALTVDRYGNVYVTGVTNYFSSSHFSIPGDYTTIKYGSDGETLWVRHYGSPESDNVSAIAVDKNGNVYVTGSSRTSGNIWPDYLTIKYSPDGEFQWEHRFDGPNSRDDDAKALVVDKFGNLYVTGKSRSDFSLDFATIKYSTDGEILWVIRYNGPYGWADGANALVVDDSGNVYVSGYSVGNGTWDDYATIKYVQRPTKSSMSEKK